MVEPDRQLLDDLVLAHRILIQQGVLDAFGHVSARDPRRADVYWLARALPPSLVTSEDILPFDLDSRLLAGEAPLFAERFIHGEIYRARPDVTAICHHHAPAIMPFCIGERNLSAVSQTAPFLGSGAPLWDSADEFGATALLVDDERQAASLARALGKASLVLMRGHGATVVGAGVKQLVFKAVYACRDADSQRRASVWGAVKQLSPGEIAKIGEPREAAVERCWSHWLAMLEVRPSTAGKERSQ